MRTCTLDAGLQSTSERLLIRTGHASLGKTTFLARNARPSRRVGIHSAPRSICVLTQAASATAPAPGKVSVEVDIDSHFELGDQDIASFRHNSFVKLPGVFNEATLAHYGPDMSLMVKEADKTPLQKDPDYAQAFTQVQQLWRKNEQVYKFVRGKRLANIAARLLGVEGVRLYADQALYKEPHGGYTPWHCDASYWPLATDKAVTAWIPLQATPQEMGPMQFAAGSQEHDLGRHLDIGRDNHKLIDAKVRQGGFNVVSEPFSLGEVSFHSSLNFHKAEGNQTERPREVFTVIFMDKDMKLADDFDALTEYQHRDRKAYFPQLQPGDLCHTELNPIIWDSATM